MVSVKNALKPMLKKTMQQTRRSVPNTRSGGRKCLSVKPKSPNISGNAERQIRARNEHDMLSIMLSAMADLSRYLAKRVVDERKPTTRIIGRHLMYAGFVFATIAKNTDNDLSRRIFNDPF